MASTSTQSQITIINSQTTLLPLLDRLTTLPTNPPSLFIDLEGIHLGRSGTISLLTLYISPLKQTYLIDIHNLQSTAFSTANKAGTTLKSILESAKIPKVFFDVRNDSDALSHHFQISVAGIKDLQLMELATRTRSREYLSGLAKCIENDLKLSISAKNEWKAVKAAGKKLFAPEKGGKYEVFNERPMRDGIVRYCDNDVKLMPALYDSYQAKLSPRGEAFWRVLVTWETKKRIELSQSAGYDGQAANRVLGWTKEFIEAEIDDWNDTLQIETNAGTHVLDENDEWVKRANLR